MGNTYTRHGTEASTVPPSVQLSFANMMIAFTHDQECQTVNIISGLDDKKSTFALNKHVNKNNSKDVIYDFSFVHNSDHDVRYVTLFETKNARKFGLFLNNNSNWNVKNNNTTIFEMYEVWKTNSMYGSRIICDSPSLSLHHLFEIFITHVRVSVLDGHLLDANLEVDADRMYISN